MAWANNILTSIFGRRLGLIPGTTNVIGANTGPTVDFLAGPEDIKMGVSTAETTAAYMKAYGVTLLTSAQTAASGAVMRLDPPIPGVRKTISIQSTASGVASTIVWWITSSTGGGAPFVGSTWSSSFTVLATSGSANIQLLGVTTGQWLIFNTSGQFLSAAATTT